jgi:hypothetical protein
MVLIVVVTSNSEFCSALSEYISEKPLTLHVKLNREQWVDIQVDARIWTGLRWCGSCPEVDLVLTVLEVWILLQRHTMIPTCRNWHPLNVFTLPIRFAATIVSMAVEVNFLWYVCVIIGCSSTTTRMPQRLDGKEDTQHQLNTRRVFVNRLI